VVDRLGGQRFFGHAHAPSHRCSRPGLAESAVEPEERRGGGVIPRARTGATSPARP
jgi:hypothetical protein